MIPTDNIIIPEKNLARNPIVAFFYGGNNLSSIFRLYEGTELNELMYEGIVYNIDDYVRVDLATFFGTLRKVAGVKSCKICLVSSDGIEYGEKIFEVYGGGISKLLTRKLAKSNYDIFSWKLKNHLGNFFLSTRTNSLKIFIPEDELLPLFYYAKGMHFNIKVDGETVAQHNNSDDNMEGLLSIDFNALRHEIVTTKHKLASVFDTHRLVTRLFV